MTKPKPIVKYLVPGRKEAKESTFASTVIQSYFRRVQLTLYHPYVQLNDGTIALLLESHWFKRDKVEEICRLGTDYEIFEICDEERFGKFCEVYNCAVVERRRL